MNILNKLIPTREKNRVCDFPAVVEKIALAFKQSRTHDDIAKNLYPLLKNDVGIEEICFFFQDNSTQNYYKWEGAFSCTAKQEIFSMNDNLIKEMLEKKDIIKNDNTLCVPSFSDGRLVAFFTLGEKDAGRGFSEQDKKLFRAIGGLIATTMEYVVKPYLEVKEEFEASERKILQAEKELMRAHRLVALGTLTAGVTHEIRNPLAVLRSSLDVLRKRHQELPFIEEFYNKMIKHVDRIENIIQKVLGLARNQQIRIEKQIDINHVIEETIKLIHFNDDVRLVKELNPLPPINCITEDMERLFINLIDNSQHAMPKGGTITLKTYSAASENGNQKVVVEFTDTGIGIPKGNMEKIFDPFFTSRHDGTGLGLSIVYRIVKEHGGDISVKSEEGHGATFTISFNT